MCRLPGIILCCIYLLITDTARGQGKDTLFLLNNQLVLGEIKGIKLGRIEFDADYLAIFKIKYTKLKTLSAKSRFFRVETIDRKVYFTTISPDTTPGFVLLKNGLNDEHVAMKNISTLTYFFRNKSFRTEGYFSAGYTYTRSSNIGRFNMDAQAAVNKPKYQLKLNISQILTQENGKWSRDREDAKLSHVYYFNSYWQLNTSLSYQRNLELGLARRYQQGLAMGYRVIEKSSMQGSLYSGLVFNQELNIQGTSGNTQVEVPVFFLYDLFNFSNPNISVKTQQYLYIGVTQKGRLRHDGKITVDWEMIPDLSLNLQLYNSFDNQPPGLNSNNFDYGTVIGLKYEF